MLSSIAKNRDNFISTEKLIKIIVKPNLIFFGKLRLVSSLLVSVQTCKGCVELQATVIAERFPIAWIDQAIFLVRVPYGTTLVVEDFLIRNLEIVSETLIKKQTYSEFHTTVQCDLVMVYRLNRNGYFLQCLRLQSSFLQIIYQVIPPELFPIFSCHSTVPWWTAVVS
jgi:hypothetical protein